MRSNSQDMEEDQLAIEKRIEETRKFYQNLLVLTSDLITTYDESRLAPEAHAELFFKDKKLSPEAQKFIFETFDGVWINQKMVGGVVSGLFNAKYAMANQADSILYKIVLYLIIYRFEDIDTKELSFLLYSQNPVTMNAILSYLFDDTLVQDHAFGILEEHYDREYLEQVFGADLRRKRTKLRKVLRKINKKATNEKIEEKKEVVNKVKKATKIEPFQLSKGRGTKIPEPIVIPTNPKYSRAKINCTKTLADIERENNERRAKVKELTMNKNEGKQFNLTQVTRAKSVKAVDEPVEQNQKPKIDYKKVLYEVEADDKWTRALILQEKRKLESEQLEEAKRLDDIEENMYDSKEFLEWQRKMLENDEKQRFTAIQARKAELKEINNNMRKAVEGEQKRREALAKEQKMISKKYEKVRQKKAEKEVEKKKELKVGVIESKKNYQRAVKEQLRDKKKQVIELKEKTEEELELNRIEQKRELERKKELVKQIKEMEGKIWKLNRFERKEQNNETAGFLLEEMDIDKLRSRLKELKTEEAKLTEMKRQAIVEKTKKERQELETIKNKVKAKREQKNKEKLDDLKHKQQTKQKEAQDYEKRLEKKELKTITKILAKKDQKQAEIKEMKKQEKEFNLKKQFMNQEKDKYEELNNKYLVVGKENIAENKQKERLIEEFAKQTVKIKDIESEDVSRKQTYKNKMNIIEHYDKALEAMKAHMS